MCMCVPTKGETRFEGVLWFRTKCPTEIGHMLDFLLDCSVTLCSNLQLSKTPQNILSVCPPPPSAALLLPLFSCPTNGRNISLNLCFFFFFFITKKGSMNAYFRSWQLIWLTLWVQWRTTNAGHHAVHQWLKYRPRSETREPTLV